MKRIATDLVGPLALLLALVGATPVSAAPLLREKLKPLAQAIVDVLEEEKQQAVAFAEFPADPFSRSNSGPGIQQALTEEVEALKKGVVQERANLIVRGRYAGVDVEDKLRREMRVVKVTISVHNRQDRNLLERSAVIDSNEDIAKILAPTGDLPLNANRQDLNRKIKDQIDNPRVFISGSRIAVSRESPYAVDILVKSDYRGKAAARAAQDKGGQAFVAIDRGELYELLLHNRADHDAAVGISIDGLDVFTFSDDRDSKTGRPKFSHFIVAARSTSSVVGWHRSNDPKRKDNMLSFLVTDYGKGAASARKSTGKTGVITVTFAAAWAGERPKDEPLSRNVGGFETGFGPPRQVGLQSVRRTVGNIREQISIRYSR